MYIVPVREDWQATWTMDDWNEHRIEHLLPFHGHEITNTVHPLACGLGDLVHPQKGCYVGQEVTARMKHKGTLKKLFHPAEFRDLPDKSKSKEVFSEGRVVGEVYSIAYPFCIIRLRQEFKKKNLKALGSELNLLS